MPLGLGGAPFSTSRLAPPSPPPPPRKGGPPNFCASVPLHGPLTPGPPPGPWTPPGRCWARRGPWPLLAKAEVGIEGNILGGSLCKLTAGGNLRKQSRDCNLVSRRGYAAPLTPLGV